MTMTNVIVIVNSHSHTKVVETLPSQQLISVDQIKDGVVILKNGGMRAVLLASGVNFELKSEEEQQAIVLAFQEFLASLDFSIELAVHSRRINIDKYLRYIESQTRNISNDLLRVQAQEYLSFVQSFVDLYAVMQKKFFAVVPYSPVEISAHAAKETLGGLLPKRKATAQTFVRYSPEELERHKNQLWTRVESVTLGLSKMGIRTIPLETEALIELFYNLYNPAAREREKAPLPVGENL